MAVKKIWGVGLQTRKRSSSLIYRKKNPPTLAKDDAKHICTDKIGFVGKTLFSTVDIMDPFIKKHSKISKPILFVFEKLIKITEKL